MYIAVLFYNRPVSPVKPDIPGYGCLIMFNICRRDFCVRKGDVEMRGDKEMTYFQIFYLHIRSYPHISSLTLLCFFKIFLTCRNLTLSHGFFWQIAGVVERMAGHVIIL
jgi:hypothetical protein